MEYGFAELPLHDGHVPRWMAEYMKRLAKAIIAVIVEEYGPSEFVRRLADPFWFQAFNNAIGMDWDSSGSTTVTIGIIRQVVNSDPSLGIIIAGGKGRLATKVPEEMPALAEQIGLASSKVEEIVYASKLAAKTDNSLLQDGYSLYHHAVVVSEDGAWTIVQQGMNPAVKLARRYHWRSPLPSTPTIEPHNAIAAARREELVVDLTSRRSITGRSTILDLARENPRKTIRLIHEAYRVLQGLKPITHWIGSGGEHVTIDQRQLRVYRPQPKPPIKSIERALRAAFEHQPRTIEELVLTEGVGPATLRSLALVAELIYGAEISHDDPARAPIDPFRYAYIVGGKDGVPFPYDPQVASEVIRFLEEAVAEARLGHKEKMRVLRRLRSLLKPTPYGPR